MKTYTVTAAIIKNENQILCMQRNKSKFEYVSCKWEFPGGKAEEGETLEKGDSHQLTGDRTEEARSRLKVHRNPLIRELTFSYGWRKYGQGMSLDGLYTSADGALYREKHKQLEI